MTTQNTTPVNFNFLNENQVRAAAPSVFTRKSHPNTSEEYSHIPTFEVLRDMKRLNWKVVKANEVKSRKYKGFQKHMLVFQNENIVITSENGDTVIPQIILTNSHDGKNSFVFRMGLFRLVCSNGLVVPMNQNSAKNISVVHYKYNFEHLQVIIRGLVDSFSIVLEHMNKFQQTKLSEEQEREFALKAIGIRFDKNGNMTIGEPDEPTINEVLTPSREEDKGNSLWVVYNRVQENLLKGTFTYKNEKNKQRKARPIKNFSQDLDLNVKLFDLALEYAN